MRTIIDVNFPNVPCVSYIVTSFFNDDANSVPYQFEGFAIWQIVLKFIPLQLTRVNFDGERCTPRVDGSNSHRSVAGSRHIGLTKNGSGGCVLSPTIVGDKVFSLYLHLHLLVPVTMANLCQADPSVMLRADIQSLIPAEQFAIRTHQSILEST